MWMECAVTVRCEGSSPWRRWCGVRAGNLEHTKLITTLLNAQWVEVSLMPGLKLFVPCYSGRRLTFRKHCAIHLFAYIFILVTHLLQTCNDMHAVNTHICFLILVQFSCFVKHFDDYHVSLHRHTPSLSVLILLFLKITKKKLLFIL